MPRATEHATCFLALLRRQLLAFAAVTLVAQPHAQTQARARLWVIQPPDALVAYDIATFEPLHTTRLPPAGVARPDDLRVNLAGRVMLLPPSGPPVTEADRAAAGRIWIWDGSRGTELRLGEERADDIPANASTVTEIERTVFLSASDEALIWLENRFDKTLEAGVERDVRLSARVWQTDLRGQQPRPIVSLPASRPCACETGVCSENCPEWTLWAPDGLVADFFLLTRVVPGQLETTVQETRLYRRSAATWVSRALPQPLELPLDASPTAAMLLAAVPDGGCCGWENAGDDQLQLWRNGRPTTIYDERVQYDNRNYDVSFYPSDARFAPQLGAVAFTITSTARPPAEIRLSMDGTANDVELARVRAAAAALPAVRIVALKGKPAALATIPRAGLVGWLDARSLLVAQDNRLIVYGADGRQLKDTAIRVRSAADAFLR